MSDFSHSNSRRKLLSFAAAGAAIAALPSVAIAEQHCIPIIGGTLCDAKIHTRRFAAVHSTQFTPVWCWAATLEMIFRWHGRSISQHRIVEQTFGSRLIAPADLITLMGLAQRTYVDDFGKAFEATSKIWSADFGIAQVDNNAIIESLRDEQPLIVCNVSHMMALVGVSYIESHWGDRSIREAWVADPMVSGVATAGMGERTLAQGFRYLLQSEMVPMPRGWLRFVADVRVSS